MKKLLIILIIGLILLNGCSSIKIDKKPKEVEDIFGIIDKIEDAFNEAEEYYKLANINFDKATTSRNIKDYKNCVKYCEELRQNVLKGNPILREMKPYLKYADNLTLLYKQIIESTLNVWDYGYIACENMESACEMWELGLIEEGNIAIIEANKHIDAHDREVERLNDLEAKKPYIIDELIKSKVI